VKPKVPPQIVPKKAVVVADEVKASALGKLVLTETSPTKVYNDMIISLNETVTFWEQETYQYISSAVNERMEKSKDLRHVGIRTLHVLTSIHGMEKKEMMYYLIFHKLDTTIYREKMKYVKSIFKDEEDFAKPVTETYTSVEDVVYSYFRKKMFKPAGDAAAAANHYYVMCITKEKKNMLMVWKNKEWRDILATEKDNADTKVWRATLNKSQNIIAKVRREFNNTEEKESIFGFMAILKTTETDGYGFKNKNVLQARNALGATCEQANRDLMLNKLSILLDIMGIPTAQVETVYDLVNNSDLLHIKIKDRSLRINKHHVCLIYELLLRHLSRKENLPWFLDLEESIETDIIHLSIAKSIVGNQHVYDIVKK
jgi:hypothetical protein